MTAGDGAKITVPICILASKDEDAAVIETFKKELKVENHVETFSDQVHVSPNCRFEESTVTDVLSR